MKEKHFVLSYTKGSSNEKYPHFPKDLSQIMKTYKCSFFEKYFYACFFNLITA